MWLVFCNWVAMHRGSILTALFFGFLTQLVWLVVSPATLFPIGIIVSILIAAIVLVLSDDEFRANH